MDDVNNARAVPTGTEAAVCQIIAERQRLGISKYGQTVADNPLDLRDWLQHALEETLDKAIYLKRAIEEIDAMGRLRQPYSEDKRQKEKAINEKQFGSE